MPNISAAIQAVLKQEREDNKTPRGADIASIIEIVAYEHSIDTDTLGKAVIEHSVPGPC